MNYVFDIETTTDHKCIRLCGIKEGNQDSLTTSKKSLVDYWLTTLGEDDTLIGWNLYGFDIPVLKKVFGIDILAMQKEQGFKIADGYIMSKMMWHDRKGGHSLAQAALHYGVSLKQEVSDIDWYNTCSIEELSSYLEADLVATAEVYSCMLYDYKTDAILKVGNWKHPMRVEAAVKTIHDKQLVRGVNIDRDLAYDLLWYLELEMDNVKARTKLPHVVANEKEIRYPPKKQFLKDGRPSAILIKYLSDYGYEAHEETRHWVASNSEGSEIALPLKYPMCTTVQLEWGKTIRIKEHLLEQGWKPTIWNYGKDKETGKTVKKSPRLTHPVTKEPCPNLDKMGADWVKDFSYYTMLLARRNLLKSPNGTGLIVKAEENGWVIPSDADTIGANTARYTHRGIVNIPRIGTPYGEHFRSIFHARKGCKFVGWDAQALEARVEGHYTAKYDGGSYAKELMEGDVHTTNMEAMGLACRDDAKTFKYAVTYGAQPAKLAQQFGWSLDHSKEVYDTFWKSNEALAQLKRDLEIQWVRLDKKYIVGLDGRLIKTRSKHSLLNALFQSAGAIIMKHAMLIADKRICQYCDTHGIEAFGLIRYHDEEVWEVEAPIDDMVRHCHDIGEIGEQSIRDAGRFLDLNVELDAEAKQGFTWGDVH